VSRVLGAILAGGQSRRFGSPKALACFAGERLVDRVTRVLRSTTDELVVIANDPALAAAIGLPWRADVLAGIGGLAGVHAALQEAAARGCAGALVVAADMPLLSSPLLAHLRTLGESGWDAVLPESEGPRGVEPLCAWYATVCRAAIERAAARGDTRLVGFLRDLRVHRVPLAEVRTFGVPELLFANLNTSADLERLERLAVETGG
jgi:molybdopterin-guanine dinucleotide biosynthesis protein A